MHKGFDYDGGRVKNKVVVLSKNPADINCQACENSANVPMDFELLGLSIAVCSEPLNNNSVSKSGKKGEGFIGLKVLAGRIPGKNLAPLSAKSPPTFFARSLSLGSQART